MKLLTLSLMALAVFTTSAGAAPPAQHSVSLTQEPLIMRLNKDEFRIAFAINGERGGCTGMIHYRVDWKTPDGTTRTERKHVNFTVSPLANRTIAVDRQYFDTAEGQHMTDVVKVHIDAISCTGVDPRAQEMARL